MHKKFLVHVLFTLVFFCLISSSFSQDRLKSMPGFERYAEMANKIRSSVKLGQVNVDWAENNESFEFVRDGKLFRYDLISLKAIEVSNAPASPPRNRRRGGPARGRQYASATSPDSLYEAYTKDRNMWILDMETGKRIPITPDGNNRTQLKYGIATWVYGEELRQNTAMWWSPKSKKIAFYRFEEKNTKKYYVLYNQIQIQDSVEIEAYPKVGAENPPVDLVIYDLDSRKRTLVDVRSGKAFNDENPGTYVYGIEWSEDGQALLFHRTNRKQDIMEYVAANPETGETHVIVREEWLQSYTRNTPEMQFLADGKRFVWASERSGFNNYYLYNLDGTLIDTLTQHPFEVSNIVKIDEVQGLMYYMARSGDNHMKMQLHKVSLDGNIDIRLTDPAYHHRVSISPDSKFITDVAQTHDIAPFTNLLDKEGNKIAGLGKSDLTEFEKLGFKRVEVFTFTSADGETELHGMLHFPSNFDPGKKYPLILSNYGGPGTNAFRETFAFPNSLTEYGFLIANIDGRNAGGRGKVFHDALYGNLGIVEMDDFAAGVKSLYNRPYFDKERVGVYGTSYGGTTAATCLLRHSDVFHVACANSAVTDWRNYDNIYTERYMNLLENNKAGYDASNLMNYAKDLKGRLMIYYGTSDNNVHPSNSLQLIKALQDAGKSFEVQIGPDRGHTALNRDRMMEFFIENLVINPPSDR